MSESQDDASLAFMAKDVHDMAIKFISLEATMKELLMMVVMGKDDRQRIMADIVFLKEKLESMDRRMAQAERRRQPPAA